MRYTPKHRYDACVDLANEHTRDVELDVGGMAFTPPKTIDSKLYIAKVGKEEFSFTINFFSKLQVIYSSRSNKIVSQTRDGMPEEPSPRLLKDVRRMVRNRIITMLNYR